MAQVKIEEIIDHLSSEIRKALENTIKEHYPDQNIDKYALFRTFRKMVGRKTNTWEEVPDDFVKKEE